MATRVLPKPKAPDSLDASELLAVLTAYKSGDFSARMSPDKIGLAGKVADTLNDIIERNERMAGEIARVCDAVAREGKSNQRIALPMASGSWGSAIDSVNQLISDLVQPTAEMGRVIGAVAKGDLGQRMSLEVDGKPLSGEFLKTAKLVNTMAEQLNGFANEVTRVAREVGTDGKLGGQANVKGVAGVWKDLTESVNSMAGNLTSPFRNADLHATAMVVTDLREQKRKEQILAEGRLAKLVLEHSHSGIAVCDQEGRIILASRRVREISGENPLFRDFDELIPLEIGEHPGSPARRFSAHEVLRGEVHKAIEATLVKAGRLTVSLLVSAGRVESDAGDTLGCVITLLDISERKAVEEVLRRSEKLAAAGRIAGTLAHEINNPLSAVTNLLFLLQNSGLDPAHQHYVDLAASELARVSRIARNTLSFYREAASPVPVQLSEVLDSVLELYQTANYGEVASDKQALRWRL